MVVLKTLSVEIWFVTHQLPVSLIPSFVFVYFVFWLKIFKVISERECLPLSILRLSTEEGFGGWGTGIWSLSLSLSWLPDSLLLLTCRAAAAFGSSCSTCSWSLLRAFFSFFSRFVRTILSLCSRASCFSVLSLSSRSLISSTFSSAENKEEKKWKNCPTVFVSLPECANYWAHIWRNLQNQHIVELAS